MSRRDFLIERGLQILISLVVVVVIFLTLFAGACEIPPITETPTEEPDKPMEVTTMFLAVGPNDSLLGATIAWTEPPPGGARRHPIAGYETRVLLVIDSVTADTLGFGATDDAVLIDTVWSTMPPLDTLVTLRTGVATRDAIGQVSSFALSPTVNILIQSLPPIPPDSVTPPDTLPAPGLPVLVSSNILPDSLTLYWGFGSQIFEYYGYAADSTALVCTSALFHDAGSSTVSITAEGICPGFVPPYSTIRYENGTLGSPEHWITSMGWGLVKDSALTESCPRKPCWRGQITAQMKYPPSLLTSPLRRVILLEDN